MPKPWARARVVSSKGHSSLNLCEEGRWRTVCANFAVLSCLSSSTRLRLMFVYFYDLWFMIMQCFWFLAKKSYARVNHVVFHRPWTHEAACSPSSASWAARCRCEDISCNHWIAGSLSQFRPELAQHRSSQLLVAWGCQLAWVTRGKNH